MGRQNRWDILLQVTPPTLAGQIRTISVCFVIFVTES